MPTLDDLRHDIDRVDEVLVRLLNERARVACEIGRLKKQIGAGSQMLQPLAIAVIGGILISMVLSLVVTPAIQYFLEK